MPVYTAQYNTPFIENDLFTVDVDILTDGVKTETVRYQTPVVMAAPWPADQVKALIQRKQDLPTMLSRITAGPVTLPADAVQPTAAQKLWDKNLMKYRRANDAVGAGVITATDTKFVALKTWLKNNNLNNANNYLDLTLT
jgi:hypothetical protein